MTVAGGGILVLICRSLLRCSVRMHVCEANGANKDVNEISKELYWLLCWYTGVSC